MTNDPERVRAVLEPHGYQLAPVNATIFGRPIRGEPWLFAPTGALFAPTGDEPGWNNALAHFLNDKAKIGPMQEELLIEDGRRENFMVFLGCDCDFKGCEKEAYKAGIRLWSEEAPEPEIVILGADTLAEAVAKVWLYVHDLEDPRKEES